MGLNIDYVREDARLLIKPDVTKQYGTESERGFNCIANNLDVLCTNYLIIIDR